MKPCACGAPVFIKKSGQCGRCYQRDWARRASQRRLGGRKSGTTWNDAVLGATEAPLPLAVVPVEPRRWLRLEQLAEVA